MQNWVIAAAFASALAGGGLTLTIDAPNATAEPVGKPLLSGMKDENEPAVQQVRNALTDFNGANKRWPSDLTALKRFTDNNGIPLDLTVFSKANYTVQQQGSASVAVFEFVVKSSQTRGAFAIADYVVK